MERLDEERIHMETIINKRVHFLIIIFTIIVAGAVNSKSIFQARMIFILGFLLSLLLSLTLARAQKRFDVLLNKIHKNPNHAATYAKLKADSSSFPTNFSVRKIIGYYIPFGIVFVMLIFSIQPDLLYYKNNEKCDLMELNTKIEKINKRIIRIDKIVNNTHNSKLKIYDE